LKNSYYYYDKWACHTTEKTTSKKGAGYLGKNWRLFSFADALKNEKISAKSKFTKCLKIVCAK
jgi:hypothetical protein